MKMSCLIIYLQTQPVIEADSLSYSLRSISDTLSVIAGNTNPMKVLNMDVEMSNLGIGFISLIIGILGVVFGWLAYRFSKKTADNVVRMTAENQIALFNDMIRHLYRNLVCILTVGRIQSSDEGHNSYPSEEHLLKMKMLPEDTIHLEKYNDNKRIYTVMHELKLLLRNYDTEIDICLMHCKERGFMQKDLLEDVGKLMFKPFYLIARIAEIENDIYRNERERKLSLIKKLLAYFNISFSPAKGPDQFEDAAAVIVSEHLSKLMENIDKLDKWKGTFRYVDYCHTEKWPESECSRGYEKFTDAVKKTRENDIVLSAAWLASPSNQNMTGSKRDRLGKEDIFAPLRQFPAFRDYLAEVSKPQISFDGFVSHLLSVDVAIEAGKIRFIDFN